MSHVWIWLERQDARSNVNRTVPWSDQRGRERRDSLLTTLLRGENVQALVQGLWAADRDWAVDEAAIALAQQSGVDFIRTSIRNRLEQLLKQTKKTTRGPARPDEERDLNPRDVAPETAQSHGNLADDIDFFADFCRSEGVFHWAYDTYFRRGILPPIVKDGTYLRRVVDAYHPEAGRGAPGGAATDAVHARHDAQLLLRLLVCEMDGRLLEWADLAKVATHALDRGCVPALLWVLLWPGACSDGERFYQQTVQGRRWEPLPSADRVPGALIAGLSHAERDVVDRSWLLRRYCRAVHTIHVDLHLSDRELVRAYGRVRDLLGWGDRERIPLQALRFHVLDRLIRDGYEDPTVFYPFLLHQSLAWNRAQPLLLGLNYNRGRLTKDDLRAARGVLTDDVRDELARQLREVEREELGAILDGVCVDGIPTEAIAWSAFDSDPTWLRVLGRVWQHGRARAVRRWPGRGLEALRRKL